MESCPAKVAVELAGMARRFGNGLIDLSARGNVQLRGVTEASHGPLVEALAALGLIDESPAAEAMRNILVTPFWKAGDAAQKIAGELAARLGELPLLPGKFGYAVDTGMIPVLRGASADIRVERLEGGSLLVRAEGMETGAAVTVETVVDAVIALARWFAEAGGISGGRGRMAALIGRGVLPEARFSETPMRQMPPFVPKVAHYAAGTLVAFEFGQMQAETLEELAGQGDMRVTPWRMLLVEGLMRAWAQGAITDAGDPRLRVVACTGAPACVQGLAPVRDLGRAMAAHVPEGAVLHLSGCAKGCAHPASAPLTLTATATGYHLIKNGSAADAPLAHVTADELLARPVLLTETFNAP